MATLTFTLQLGANTKTLTIADAKLDDFQTAFLAANPIPNAMGDNGIPAPEFDNSFDWFGAYLKRHLFRQYQVGKYKIREQQNAGIDPDVITES